MYNALTKVTAGHVVAELEVWVSILSRGKVSHEHRLEVIEKHLHTVEGDVAWLKEYFTPDDDGSDRFTRIEGRLDSLGAKVDGILDRLETIENRLPFALTQAEYDSLETKEEHRLYIIVERAQ